MWDWVTSADAANFGQFVGSLLTAISIGLAFYIILRDKRNHEREQINQVLTRVELINNRSAKYMLQNNSDKPIVAPHLVIRSRMWWEHIAYCMRRRKWTKRRHYLYEWLMLDFAAPAGNSIPAGEKASADLPSLPQDVEDRALKHFILIFDARGKFWVVDAAGLGVLGGRRRYLREMERKRRAGMSMIAATRGMTRRQWENRSMKALEDPHNGGDQTGGDQATFQGSG